MVKIDTPHLDWVSEVSVDDLVNEAPEREYPCLTELGLVFMAPVETGSTRTVVGLYLESSEDVSAKRSPRLLTSNAYDVGTDIHEYGGKPYWVNGREIVFSDRKTRCLYRFELPQASEDSAAGAE